MSGRWKPGDVAMVTSPLTEPTVRILETCREPRWWGGDGYVEAANARDVRPLVVIDPEDREQVERLMLAQWRAHGNEHVMRDRVGELLSKFQAALRSLVAPPKPDEPQGLGAVVEDAEGRRWVRKGDDEALDRWASQIGRVFTSRDYNTIDAVRVLSEGVTP